MSHPNLNVDALRLGPWLVQPSFNQLELDGEVEQLEPQVMSVLVLLFEKRGSVVSREELLEACWHGLCVSDDVITRCISRLRKALRLDPDGRVTIRTISKRGYCLEVLEEAGLATTAEPGAEEPAPLPAPVAMHMPSRPVRRWPTELGSFAAGIAACLLAVMIVGPPILLGASVQERSTTGPVPAVPQLVFNREAVFEAAARPLGDWRLDLLPEVSIAPVRPVSTEPEDQKSPGEGEARIDRELAALERQIEARLEEAIARRLAATPSDMRRLASARSCSSAPAVAPGGDAVAFIACEEGGGAAIAVMDSASRAVRRLEPNFDHLESLAWGAPGTLLVSGSLEGEHAFFEVELGGADGARAAPLTAAATGERMPSTGLYAVGFEGEPPERLRGIARNPRYPDVARDGALAFASRGSDGETLWVQKRGEGASELAEIEGVVSGLSWSPDGSRIAVVVDEDGASHILLVDTETGKRVVHADNGRAKRSPAWDADGEKLFFAERHASWRIEELNLARSTQRTVSPPGYDQVRSSPDGHQRYFARSEAGGGLELLADPECECGRGEGRVQLRGSSGWPRIARGLWRVAGSEVVYLEWSSPGRARLVRRELDTGEVTRGPVLSGVDSTSTIALAAGGRSVILVRRAREERRPVTLAGGGAGGPRVLPRDRSPVTLSAMPQTGPK